MSGTIVFCAAVCYTAALFFELTKFKFQRYGRILRGSFIILGAGLLTVYLGTEHIRLASPTKFFLTAAWGLTIAELALLFFRTSMSSGVILLPLIILFIGTSWLLTENRGIVLSNTYRSLVLIHSHTTLILAATVCLCMSFFAAVMYLLQDVRLRRKQLPSENVKLPTLEWSLSVCRWSLMLTLVLFFCGIFFGVHLAAMQKMNLTAIFFRDPLLFGTAVLLPVLLLCLILPPKNNGRFVSWSVVFVFLCLLAVLIFALFGNFSHWKRNEMLGEGIRINERHLHLMGFSLPAQDNCVKNISLQPLSVTSTVNH